MFDCRILEKNKIPLLVLSAGLGDVLTEVLKYHGLTENDHFHIISNFFKLNQDSVVEGYGVGESGCFIHPFNKSGLGCGSYFKVSCYHLSVILYEFKLLSNFEVIQNEMKTSNAFRK